MIQSIKFVLLIIIALLFQVTLFPAHLADPFKPNLLIIAIAYLGLKVSSPVGGVGVFLLGLVQDCFSGLYLGLNGFSYLSIYLLLRQISDRVYTDSQYLMVLVVFLATVANGLVHLVLLMLFSSAHGIYATLLSGLIPQALVNALISSFLFGFFRLSSLEEGK